MQGVEIIISANMVPIKITDFEDNSYEQAHQATLEL